jgi:hypothetical protein
MLTWLTAWSLVWHRDTFNHKITYAKRLARLAGITNDPSAELLQDAADKAFIASEAETPFLFSVEPSNMAESIVMSKVESRRWNYHS